MNVDTSVDTKGISSDAGAAPANPQVDGQQPDKKGAEAPQAVEVKLGDKSISVAPEVAEALKAAQKQAEDAGLTAKQVKDEMDALRAQLEAAVGGKKPDANSGDELEVKLFTDPKGAIEEIVAKAVAEAEARRTQATAQNEFWTEFYNQNKDLKEYDDYVKFVFQRELPAMKAAKITVAEAIKKLGEAAKGEILKIKGQQPAKGGSKPVAEGGNEPGNSGKGSKSKEGVSEDSPTTTASILAERAAARRAARQPGRKS